MTITRIGVTTSSQNNTNATMTTTLPSGFAPGDLLIALWAVGTGTQTVTTPSGWTDLNGAYVNGGAAGDCRTKVFYRVASGDESAPSFVMSAGRAQVVTIAAYRGTPRTSPIRTFTTFNTPGTGVAVITSSSLSLQANEWVVAYASGGFTGGGSNTWTTEGGGFVANELSDLRTSNAVNTPDEGTTAIDSNGPVGSAVAVTATFTSTANFLSADAAVAWALALTDASPPAPLRSGIFGTVS